MGRAVFNDFMQFRFPSCILHWRITQAPISLFTWASKVKNIVNFFEVRHIYVAYSGKSEEQRTNI